MLMRAKPWILALYNAINTPEQSGLNWVETELLDNDLSLHN
jgi:hypothetical protein